MRSCLALISGLALWTSCATPSGESLTQLADRLAGADVVFFGEIHDNTVGHEQQRELLRLLHERRPDLALSMEMFERDVQGDLDAYLAGEIEEAEFLEKARPWKQYRRHYHPLVEYAKAEELDVIAANLPRKIAKEVSDEGSSAAAQNPHAARSSTAPKDEYWENFKVAMREHLGADEEGAMLRFYEAQCLKDDTMAESITDYLARARSDGRTPLVVHVCGKFHSDFGLGTAARVAQRMPDLRLEVVSMEDRGNVVRNPRGDYVLMVPPQPEFEGKEKPADEAQPGAEPEVSEGARPGLGFMPGYDEAVIGVLVSALRPGGPADQGGMREGDIILALGEEEIADLGTYMEVLGEQKIGSEIEVRVDRDGETLTLKVVVGQSHR